MTTLSIINGHLIDPENNIDQQLDIHISDSVITAIGLAPKDFRADNTIDATGLVICPGLIDMSVHSREPGLEYKATLASETRAAASNGITTICVQPNTDPIIDTPAVAEFIHENANIQGICRVRTMGAITRQLEGSHLSDIGALRDSGCICLSDGAQHIENNRTLRRALSYASTFDMLVVLWSQDNRLDNHSVAHEGIIGTRLGLAGSPEVAETVAVSRNLLIADDVKAKIHLRGISTGKSCNLIRRAQHDGNQVTADVAIHQLHLTEMDLDGFNSLCHVQPPLRTYEDRELLRKAVADGTISCICSDHQPHETDAKNAPFGQTEAGISGLDTLLPLTLKLVDDGVLSLSKAIACLTSGPANALGLPQGKLDVGNSADICIFDPDAHYILNTDNFISAGKNSPFNQWNLRGRVRYTMVNGNITFDSAR